MIAISLKWISTGITLNLEIFEIKWISIAPCACKIKIGERNFVRLYILSVADIGNVIINLIKLYETVMIYRGPNTPRESPRKSLPQQFLVSLAEISKCNRAFYRFSIMKAVRYACARARECTRCKAIAKTWQMIHIVCVSLDLRRVNNQRERRPT